MKKCPCCSGKDNKISLSDRMSLFVDLRQIKSSVTNLSEMVDKLSGCKKEQIPQEPQKMESYLYTSSKYKPTSLGFGVRFPSQEDIYREMPSSRLRSHMSLPNLGKTGEGLDKPSVSRYDSTPKIVEIDDEKSDSRRPTIQLSTENLSEWIVASINKRPHYDDTGDTHPMDFIESVKYYITELNMAEDKQLPFIISCLEGVPLMWARCFRTEFKNVEGFYKAFEQEFWGPDRQKSVLYDLKLGKYDESSTRMSMSEYFLHKVSNYRHLNPPPSDLEIVYSLAAHFPTAVELELRLTPKPTLRDAYRLLRRRDGEASDFLPNYLYEMCEAFQRGQRPDSARRHDPQSSASEGGTKGTNALHESEGNWTERECWAAREGGALWSEQARACRRQPTAMPHVAAAARLARAACLAAHEGERWNCSSIELAPTFTPDLLTGTREQAYVYAMSAAALAWSVARACAAGALPACSCAAPPRAPPRPPRQAQVAPTEPHARFKWGGCGDNFQWAERFAKQFLDAHEMDVRDGKIEDAFEIETTTTTERSTTTTTLEPTTAPPNVILVDDQPAPANATIAPKKGRKGRRGRKRLPRSPRRGRPTRKRFRSRSRFDIEDRGSRYRNIEYRMAADDPRFDPQVDLRTRLEKLRPLIAMANLINGRFGRKAVSAGMRTKCTCHGVSGSCSVRTCWRALPPLTRVASALAAETGRAAALRPRRRRARPRLTYVTPSPDYCEPDPAAGSLGTHGRKCNASLGSAAGGCARLCCGRGRRAVRSSRLERCHCRYHWCCRVDCQLCRLTTEDHYCN